MVINTYPRKHQYLTAVVSLQLILISEVAENNIALSQGYNNPFLSPQLLITVSLYPCTMGGTKQQSSTDLCHPGRFPGLLCNREGGVKENGPMSSQTPLL